MLLIPLVTGAAIGLADGGRVVPVLLLTTAVLALFWLRLQLKVGLAPTACGCRREKIANSWARFFCRWRRSPSRV